MSIIQLPKYLSELISRTEGVGREEEKNESRPVKGFKGIFERQAAGSAKSANGEQKVAYGMLADQVNEGDEGFLPTPGLQTVLFIGTKGVTTIKEVAIRLTSFVKYATKTLGMNEATASVYVIDRFNHAWNIAQRSNFRPSQSNATGAKAVQDIVRAGIAAGIDPKVLEARTAQVMKEELEALQKAS